MRCVMWEGRLRSQLACQDRGWALSRTRAAPVASAGASDQMAIGRVSRVSVGLLQGAAFSPLPTYLSAVAGRQESLDGRILWSRGLDVSEAVQRLRAHRRRRPALKREI